jgi:hypothetical protein
LIDEVFKVNDIKKWRMDYSKYAEPSQGLEGIAATLVQLILVFSVLFGVYTFFEKTELESDFKLTSLKTNSVSATEADLWGGNRSGE